VLGVKKRDLHLPYGYYNKGNWDQVEHLIEEAFTPIVIAAAKEQGVA
jgi:hypothetical protein